MKKTAGIIVKALIGLILLILVALFTIPVLFKDKIRVKVEEVIAESVNADVRFEDYRLGFFRNFPNLSFSLDNVSVVGVDKFRNDTLAAVRSFNLVFNLASLFGSAYEVRSVVVDGARIHVIYLKDGSANYDIMKDTTETTTSEEPSDMKIKLNRVKVLNSSVSYVDKESDMSAYLNNLEFELRGDMTMSETDLQIAATSDLTFIMEGMKYLNRAAMDANIDLLANIDSMKFTFRENYLSLNDLRMKFTGTVEMPGDDIATNLDFATENTSLKSLLSLIPSIYTEEYKDLKTTGDFKLSGYARGVYSDADSTLPDIGLKLSVANGSISYPSLPEKISNINISSAIFVDGKDMDKTTVDVSRFHMELAGSPFDMTFNLKTPISDPDFKGSMIGKIDFGALSKAIPMDSLSLSGIMDMSVQMAGRMSMVEKGMYDKFNASGNLNISKMVIAMTGYPEVAINSASLQFTPAYAEMKNTSLNVGGKSDFNLTGQLGNYIPYMFSKGTIKGSMSMRSNFVDAGEIMSKMAVDTTAIDTTALAVMKVPKNIDFVFDAAIGQFAYNAIKAQNLKGKIIIHDGILSLRETGMNIIGGTVTMNADYDTRDTLKPVMRADFSINNIGVKDAFNTFNTVQKLAPAAKGIDGKVNATLQYESLLGKDMMPVISTISGGGKLKSDEITLVESSAFSKMKDVLKLGDKYTNTFRDINISFNIKDGRIFVSPFDTKVGNIAMNVSGDQGLDQTINYLVKTTIPRSDLGGSVNSLIDNLSSQAAKYGINYKPSDVLKVNLKITGTFGKPVVAPVFGSGEPGQSTGSGVKETVKETVKESVNKAVDTGKDKLRKEAEERGDKLIAEAEARAQQIRDEAAGAAEKIMQEADSQAQKLIDGAASKGTLAKAAAQKSAEGIRREADKRAKQLTTEADEKANKLVEEAKAQKQDMINKIQ
jgi:uncharacterized protein involved in outer membrane biogenesis